jgi:hypothetical protein
MAPTQERPVDLQQVEGGNTRPLSRRRTFLKTGSRVPIEARPSRCAVAMQATRSARDRALADCGCARSRPRGLEHRIMVLPSPARYDSLLRRARNYHASLRLAVPPRRNGRARSSRRRVAGVCNPTTAAAAAAEQANRTFSPGRSNSAALCCRGGDCDDGFPAGQKAERVRERPGKCPMISADLLSRVGRSCASTHPEKTIFTRFIPALKPGQGVGMWRHYYSAVEQ